MYEIKRLSRLHRGYSLTPLLHLLPILYILNLIQHIFMFATWRNKRDDECIIKSEIAASISTMQTEPCLALDAVQIACLPPLHTPLIITISVISDSVLISPKISPNIHNVLLTMLRHSNIWTNLHYRVTIEATENGFKIALNDQLYDNSTFNDLMLAPSELISLNKLELQTLNTINITISLVHLQSNGFFQSWYSSRFIQDLNMAMFENFFRLEAKFPLVFNYVSRSKYLASKDLLPVIVSTCIKNKDTLVIHQRSILSGILKNMIHCNSWIYHVKTMHHGTLQNKFSDPKHFTVQWFNHASL